MVGIKAQETLLGTYEVSGKTKVVCACRDFTEDKYRLFDFCSIKNTILDSESGGSGTELADIMETGDFYMMILRKRQALRQFMTAEAVCCHRQMRGSWNRHW